MVSSAESARLGDPTCDASTLSTLACRSRSFDRGMSSDGTVGVSMLSRSSNSRMFDDRSNNRALRRCNSSSPCNADSADTSSSMAAEG